MKTRRKSSQRTDSGFALMIILIVAGLALLVLASTLNRAETVSTLNERSAQLTVNQNAAEAAVELVYAQMAYDFASGGGLATVQANISSYQGRVPTSSQNPYWANFQFSDGQGNVGKTYVAFEYNYTGNLPSQYVVNGVTLSTAAAPVYRIMSNAHCVNGYASTVTNAVQEDVLLALVPLTSYAIFYNGILEFSSCAAMTVNGRVHANGAIYSGTDASLTVNGAMTTTGTLSDPANDGHATWNVTNGDGCVYTSGYTTNVPSVTISMNMTNSHTLIEIPTNSNASTVAGAQELYNQAQTILMVSNNTVTFQIQASPTSGQVPGTDTSPVILSTNNTPAALANLFPFLTTTNIFRDQRNLQKTNLTTQIDLGLYATWAATNSSILGKLSPSANQYPEILYVADERTNNANQLDAVRLTDGLDLPANGGLGFSVATPNILYVLGNYNCTNSAYLATSNTSATVPSALMCDSLTILSTNWSDRNSLTNSYSGSLNAWNAAAATTVNAALLTGIVPSTGTGSSQYSGGVNNITRLLEDWSSSSLYLNTSILSLFSSVEGNYPFLYQGTCYNPPTRHFNFDTNYFNPAKQPPGIPCALVPLRFNWAAPAPNTISYSVTPTSD